MKTFQHFNEDIEERRAAARERTIRRSQQEKEKVEAYRELQLQRREEQRAKEQRAKEDQELIRKTTERVRSELQDD